MTSVSQISLYIIHDDYGMNINTCQAGTNKITVSYWLADGELPTMQCKCVSITFSRKTGSQETSKIQYVYSDTP